MTRVKIPRKGADVPPDAAKRKRLTSRKTSRKARAKERDANEQFQKKKMKKEKSKKRGPETFKIYVYKVLKTRDPKLGISKMAMSIINSMIFDMFDKIAGEASKLAQYRKKETIGTREIESAVKLIFPGELADTAMKSGTRAITNFNNRGDVAPPALMESNFSETA
ncbi:unnamed protein product [Calypogeia fissa]